MRTYSILLPLSLNSHSIIAELKEQIMVDDLDLLNFYSNFSDLLISTTPVEALHAWLAEVLAESIYSGRYGDGNGRPMAEYTVHLLRALASEYYQALNNHSFSNLSLTPVQLILNYSILVLEAK